MTREELEHAIRAACEVSRDTEVWVFGSQAILGEYPDASDQLRRSVEVDIAPKNHPASKLVAFRERDRRFVRILIADGLISVEVLLDRVRALPVEPDGRTQLILWIEVNAE